MSRKKLKILILELKKLIFMAYKYNFFNIFEVEMGFIEKFGFY
jgi:hypothetical protein